MNSILASVLRSVFLFALVAGASAREAIVWREGHGDLAINRIVGQWRFGVVMDAFPGAEFAPNEVVIQMTASARLEIPDLPAFQFLGKPNDPIWIAPQGQIPGMPYLGLSSEATPSGTFADDRFDVLLSSVAGPGGFVMWTNGSTDTPEIYMDSRDGFSSREGYDLPSGGHNHMNWGFTAPGTYHLGLVASGMPFGESGSITSEEVPYWFEAGVLKEGEVDIELGLVAGELKFRVRDRMIDTEHEPSHVALHAGPQSRWTIPGDPAYSFLGSRGDSVYLFDQEPSRDGLWLGLASEQLDIGAGETDCVQVQLVELEGPGNLYYYEIDSEGIPTLRFNSADGLSRSDTVCVGSESRVHRNWAFSAPGFYQVTLVASREQSGGETVMSARETFWFEVFAPEFLDRGVVDLDISLAGEELEIDLQDEATGRAFCASDVVLVGDGRVMRFVPADEAFRFLGAPDSATYVFPQAEREGVLCLGVAASEIEAGTVDGDGVELELVEVNGPGDFALFAGIEPDLSTMFMNSADGVDEADRLPIRAGGRSKLNWAFSAAGEYQVRVKAVGQPVGGDSTVESTEATLNFVIRPSDPPVLSMRLVDGGSNLQLSWASKTGRRYQLQARTQLGDGEWRAEGESILGDGGVLRLTVPIADDGFRLFQLLEMP